jgi:nitroreductase
MTDVVAPRGQAKHAAGARALGLGATLTTLHLNFEKEVEAPLGLPADVHSYAILPIGYPMGRFGPVRRVSERAGQI